ncbi:uncharacterized protein B0H18DRAFT_873442 [Fomitopsis serialis]|uniref:uncharacterized protein n=1 Tax=Fomitopsis serialis TaxID=139415 RepID=UPI0020082AFB|nr:uncharacterized protein B0H18DRAFT_873442 [Neoantrodia serialis]KAH9930109.1 hypothetical protein B0H18DRAFT_873442 [Neoantrodia serialis]
MHLVWENVIKNLVALWTGQYRELDSGREDYELSPETWKIIGEATAASGSTIPSAYGPRPPNIDTDKQACTADSWSFWTLYIAPVVLRGRFRHEKYYKHFIKLVKILHVCLQFEMTRSEVADVRRGLAEWVEEYEKIYYQNTPSRLAACPLTIHALLHVADSIEAAGPVWASWAFPMERYCGMLKPAIRSRRFPYTTLAHYVLDTARLLQVKLVYDAADVLSLRRPMQDMSTTFPEYQMCALLPPSRKAVTLDKAVHDKIISHLSTRFEAPVRDVRAMLRPETITQWGKLQILGGGDLVRSTTLGGIREDSRNASYVRYESLVDKFAGQRNRPSVFELRTFYGELQHIVSLDVQVTDTAGARRVETLILAGIRTCKLDDRPSPGGLDIHYYTTTGRYEVVDINNIQCLVGRIHDRGQWAIVDRSGSLARAIYVEEDIN